MSTPADRLFLSPVITARSTNCSLPATDKTLGIAHQYLNKALLAPPLQRSLDTRHSLSMVRTQSQNSACGPRNLAHEPSAVRSVTTGSPAAWERVLHQAHAAEAEVTKLRQQLQSEQPSPIEAGPVLARLQQAQAALEPYVASQLPEAQAIKTRLIALRWLLSLAMKNATEPWTQTEQLAQLTALLGDGSPEQLGTLSQEEIHRLLEIEPASVKSLFDLGLKLDYIARLSTQSLQTWLELDPAEVKKFFEFGLSPDQLAESTPEQRKSLLSLNADVAKGLLAAGMTVSDLLAHAASVTKEDLGLPYFLPQLADQLAEGVPAEQAIASARISTEHRPTDEELSDPRFVLDLSDAYVNGFGDSYQSQLEYARGCRLARQLQIPSYKVLELSLQEINQLLSLSLDGLLKFSAQGYTLRELAQLTPQTQTHLSSLDSSFIDWARQLGPVTLAEIGALTEQQVRDLQAVQYRGFQTVPSDAMFNDILKTSISRPMGLAGGLVFFETDSGQRILASQGSNRALYNHALGLLEMRSQETIDEVRDANELPPESEVHVMDLATAELENPEQADSRPITVAELVMKNLMGKYRDMVDKGTIEHSDPRARFIRAVEARSALSDGYQFLPYYEAQSGWGGTYRTYRGGEDNPSFATATPADLREMLNQGAVDNQIFDLMADPAIAADYQAALNDGIGTLPNKQEIIDRLYSALTGPQYIATLKQLKAQGLSYEAEQMTQRDLSSLALLDPQKANDAAQKLTINSLGDEFDALAADPSMIDIPSFAVSTEDAISVVTRIIKLMAGGVRHGSQITTDFVKFLNEFKGNKKSVTALSGVIKQIVIDAKNGKPYNLGTITLEQFEDVMRRTYLPADMQGKVRKFFTTAQKFGVWGSISGAAAMVGFVYRLMHGAWGPNSTLWERWGAARDLITFVSVASHVAKTGAGAIDFLTTWILGKDTNSQLAFKALGLDRSLPQLWGKKSLLPGEKNWSQWLGDSSETPRPSPGDALTQPLLPEGSLRNPEAMQAFEDASDRLWEPYDNSAAHIENATPEEFRPRVQAAVDNLSQFLEPATPLKPLGGLTRRISLSAFKVLCTVIDLAGIADIVFAAIHIKRAIAEGDVPGIVGNSLNIVGGVGLTGAGAIGTLALFAPVSAALEAAVAPLFLTGTIFAMAGFTVSMLTQAFKRHNALQHSTEDQTEWFRNLHADGLAYEGWENKLEYLRYAYCWFGNDNPNPNLSYFKFQEAEWEFFLDTPQKDGSSLNRLNSDLHQYTEYTLPPPTLEDNDATERLNMDL